MLTRRGLGIRFVEVRAMRNGHWDVLADFAVRLPRSDRRQIKGIGAVSIQTPNTQHQSAIDGRADTDVVNRSPELHYGLPRNDLHDKRPRLRRCSVMGQENKDGARRIQMLLLVLLDTALGEKDHPSGECGCRSGRK